MEKLLGKRIIIMWNEQCCLITTKLDPNLFMVNRTCVKFDKYYYVRDLCTTSSSGKPSTQTYSIVFTPHKVHALAT